MEGLDKQILLFLFYVWNLSKIFFLLFNKKENSKSYSSLYMCLPRHIWLKYLNREQAFL